MCRDMTYKIRSTTEWISPNLDHYYADNLKVEAIAGEKQESVKRTAKDNRDSLERKEKIGSPSYENSTSQ